MATLTPNLELTLPDGSERVSRATINTNNTLIDTAFGEDRAAIETLNSEVAKLIGVKVIEVTMPSTATNPYRPGTIDQLCGTSGKTIFNTVILSTAWHNTNNSWYTQNNLVGLQDDALRMDGSNSAFFGQKVKIMFGFLPEEG